MIAEVDDGQIEAATNLLHRFFCEEGFAGYRLGPTSMRCATISIIGLPVPVRTANWLAL
jgi:hypothetical protein